MFDLHNQTLALVQEERRLTGQIVINLQKISDQNLHLKMGYRSLFDYCTRALGYSESCAYRRISAVKVSRFAPEITTKLNEGTLSLTSVALAQNFFYTAQKTDRALSTETKKQILITLENCNKSESEEKLIQAATRLGLDNTGLDIKEKLRLVSESESVLHIRLPNSTIEKLRRLRSLRAHKNPNMSYAELIEDLCTYALKKLDPMAGVTAGAASEDATAGDAASEKAQLGAHAALLANSAAATTTGSKTTVLAMKASRDPRYIPTPIRREVWRRDKGRCTFTIFDSQTNQQRNCGSNHLLQVDHIQPVAIGGPATKENLRLLCHAHHQLRDFKKLPPQLDPINPAPQ